MILAPFELHRPQTVEEATSLLDEHGDEAMLYCSGYTGLLLLAEEMGFASFEHLVDTKAIGELAGIREDGDTLVVGATVTHRQIERSPLVLRTRLPALAAMERQVANVRVRTVGTLAGNLCFSSPNQTRRPSCSRSTRRSRAVEATDRPGGDRFATSSAARTSRCSSTGSWC